MKKKITELLATDKKLRALFSGMIGSGAALIGLVIMAGVMYL
jgi:hypothetical protein